MVTVMYQMVPFKGERSRLAIFKFELSTALYCLKIAVCNINSVAEQIVEKFVAC